MRSFARLALFTATAVVLSGCATFTDSDVAARVGDDELTNDDLTAVARDQLDADVDRADMQVVIGILNDWVLDRVLRADLAANGTPLEDPSDELTRASLTEAIQESFTAWQQAPATPIDDADVRARYEMGPVESNMICTAHVLVDTEDTANEVLDRLDDGDAFPDLAAEYSIDSSGATGGNLPCSTTADFANQYIPEYVDAALDADIGDPVGPVESQFGYHVILLRPYDDAAADLEGVLATPQVRFDFASSDLDVYIDPRYGSFNASSGILPLG